MNYDIIHKNPYTEEKFPEHSKGLLIKCKWNNEFIDIITKENIDILFLNYAHGWQCDTYSFLANIPLLSQIKIIDIHDRGIEAIEKQNILRDISLGMHVTTKIDFSQFKKLENCFLNWRKNLSSIFQATSLKYLYIDNLKVKDNHELKNLQSLEKLTIGNSNITQLDFLANFTKLKTLELLNCRRVENFKPISELNSLTRLRIDGYKDIGAIDFVSSLNKLDTLLLNVGKINNIHCLSTLKTLKAIAFSGASASILDGDLSPLTELPKLAMLRVYNKRHYSHKLIKEWSWKNFDIPDKLLEKKKK